MRRIFSLKRRRGQATTEVVLLFPIFMLFLFAFAKIFALLIVVQKLEIASYYAARRWQLESHRNVDYEGFDNGALRKDIEDKVMQYVGYGTSVEKFLDLGFTCGANKSVGVKVERTQVWNVMTVTICTNPIEIGWMYKSKGFTFEVTKYVPNRDRPIAFILPGLQS
jgi:hypothetical protein